MRNILGNVFVRIVVFAILLVAGLALYFLLSQAVIGVILFLVAIVGFGLQIFDSFTKKPDNGAALAEIIKLSQEKEAKLKAEYEAKERALGAEASKAKKETTSVNKVLAKINATLDKEHISKEELIDKLKESQYTILIQKHNEDDEKLIRDRLYALGFKHINSGIYVLPPVKAREWGVTESFDIEAWVKAHLLKGLPNDYKRMINFATIIDFKRTTAHNHNNMVKRSRTYLDVLEPAALSSQIS